jgi:hypothetical protein
MALYSSPSHLSRVFSSPLGHVCEGQKYPRLTPAHNIPHPIRKDVKIDSGLWRGLTRPASWSIYRPHNTTNSILTKVRPCVLFFSNLSLHLHLFYSPDFQPITTPSFNNCYYLSTQSQAGLRFDPIIHFDALLLIFPGLANILSSPVRRLSHSRTIDTTVPKRLARPSPKSHTPLCTPTHTSHYGRLARTYLASIAPPT